MTTARAWHGLTAATALAALLLQFALVLSGSAVLAESDAKSDPLGLLLRVGRFFAYFTVQSNLLVLVSVAPLWRNPFTDAFWWRVTRLAGVVGILVTGVVHFFLLRPLLELEGWSFVADRLLHVAVPLLAVVGWVWLGPRPRVTMRVILIAFVWPVLWLVWTMGTGALSGWYPYPFLNPANDGGVTVALACVGVTTLLLLCLLAASGLDRRLPERGPDAAGSSG